MKYMGSKSRIAKDIVPIIQKCIDDNNLETYIEPFVGGANVIDKIKNSFRYGYDSNEYLIDFWNEIKNGWNPLDNITMTKELYDDIKTNKDKYASCVVALAGLCATYNAKWFGGYAGIVHTKIGTERNYYDEAVRNVLKQTTNIKDVTFENKNFFDCSGFNTEPCMVYCDPPYQGTTKYSSDDFDYDSYWEKVRELSRNNFVLCSEYNAPDDFIEIWSKGLTCTLDKSSRSTAVEKLFTYKNGKYADYIKE